MSEICFNFRVIDLFAQTSFGKEKVSGSLCGKGTVRYLLGECNDLHGGLEVVFRHHYMVFDK